MLNPSIFSFENSDMSGFEIRVDPDQLASQNQLIFLLIIFWNFFTCKISTSIYYYVLLEISYVNKPICIKCQL